jgi:AcrR family transcriptional regulator
MTIHTKSAILTKAKRIFATNGYEGFSMRILAKETGVGLSSIYHFFTDKDEILNEIFHTTTKQLGAERKKLPLPTSAQDMLLDRINFQFQQIEDIVFVLKYYLHFRPNFLKMNSGYLPSNSYMHIKEVLMFGVDTGEFSISSLDIDKESKVIAHAINGFLLEYYPHPPKNQELEEVVTSVHEFLLRSLTNREVLMS